MANQITEFKAVHKFIPETSKPDDTHLQSQRVVSSTPASLKTEKGKKKKKKEKKKLLSFLQACFIWGEAHTVLFLND